MFNVQITNTRKPQAHCDVAIATHPSDASRVVVASKHVVNVAEGKCHVDVHYSTTAGATWKLGPTLTLPNGAYGILSPSLVWDTAGNLFLAVAACSGSSKGKGTGIFVYKSSDGGASWSLPVGVGVGSDFPALASDPISGAVYLVGRDPKAIYFATSNNGGGSWAVTKSGGKPKQLNTSTLDYEVSAPSIAVGTDPPASTVLIAWYSDGSIYGTYSADGGVTFMTAHRLAISAPGSELREPIVMDSDLSFPDLGDDYQYLGAPSCAAHGRTFAVAWTSFPTLQITFKVVHDSEVNALFGAKEQSIDRPGRLCFNPQLACAPDSTVGCAFFLVESMSPDPLMGVSFAVVPENNQRTNVSDADWKPSVGALTSNGKTDLSFVREPFGFAADASSRWQAVWPDTRTGTRELWTTEFPTPIKTLPPPYFEAAVKVLFGVIQDGGGVTHPGGRIPPWGPPDGILVSALSYLLADKLEGARGTALEHAALKTLAQGALQELGSRGVSREELLGLVPH